MYNLKPNAPLKIHNNFRPINTNIEKLQIYKLMPQLTNITNKLTLIHSLIKFQNNHNTH